MRQRAAQAILFDAQMPCVHDPFGIGHSHPEFTIVTIGIRCRRVPPNGQV